MSQLACQKHLFNLPEDVTFLNCAFMSPMLQEVEAMGIAGIQKRRLPADITKADFFEKPHQVRVAFAELIGCSQPNRISILPSVSYGMSTVANNIRFSRGDELVVLEEQFPSNIYPWMKLSEEKGLNIKTVLPPVASQDRGRIWNQRILEAITPRTRVVAMGYIHWADGTLFDLVEIRKRTREVEALLIIDGTQSVGALPFEVKEIDPDALICAAYKWLMGPYSMALGYFGSYFDNGQPIEENWKNRLNSENFANLVNYQPQYQPLALRYDVGEASNFILIPMLLAALSQIRTWDIPAIQHYCQQLTKPYLNQLVDEGFIIEDDAYRAAHLFGIRIPPHINLSSLTERFQQAHIHVSVRGNAIRVSPHLYNTEKDLQHFINACLYREVERSN